MAGAVVVVLAAGYLLVLRNETVAPALVSGAPAAVIGSGSDAVAVGADGSIQTWRPPPEEDSLPSLPISEPPEKGRLDGTLLEQARVLGAAPAALRPHLEGSTYGESGVDVQLRSGIELRFGDAANAAEKWRAAATVLADPSITALDYVDLHAPSRPAVHGSGHLLPSQP
jgi:hypothetical protein